MQLIHLLFTASKWSGTFCASLELQKHFVRFIDYVIQSTFKVKIVLQG